MPTLLITGAASGIGRAAALRFARDGWRCVLADRDRPGLERLLAELPAPHDGRHAARDLDLTDPAQAARLGEGLPALDALVVCAWTSGATAVPLLVQ